jgi:hypothetical protein
MEICSKTEMTCMVRNDMAVDIGGVDITPSTSQMAYSLRQVLFMKPKDHKPATSSKTYLGFEINEICLITAVGSRLILVFRNT